MLPCCYWPILLFLYISKADLLIEISASPILPEPSHWSLHLNRLDSVYLNRDTSVCFRCSVLVHLVDLPRNNSCSQLIMCHFTSNETNEKERKTREVKSRGKECLRPRLQTALLGHSSLVKVHRS